MYKNRNAVDTKIASEREKHKSIYSGPSSLESGGKIGGGSGPSSIESGKFPYSRTSGHSSLDSQSSNNTVTTSQSPPVRKSSTTTNRKTLSDIEIGLPSSQSNNSITLQVTNSGSSAAMPSTKIFVQNSPVRSVITFENGKLSENSNVYIINSEKTTHANGEVTTHKSVSQPSYRTQVKMAPKATFSDCEETEETGDSLSMISETSPDSSLTVNNDHLEVNKFTKNINNEHATRLMNNKKLNNIQLPQNGGNFVYKNVLKEAPPSPPSPNNKNFFGDNKSYEQMAGSVGNLRQLNDSQPKKLNSNLDLKTAVENNLKLQKPNMSMVNLLRKNSEPNLSVKTIEKQKISDSAKKENVDRENGGGGGYNFPSLTDLSFNFTSIAAQKILQGVSINSIDTLCELNLQNQEKAAAAANGQANITDYGMV